MSTPHQSPRSEAAIVGTLLLHPALIGRVLVDHGLRPEHIADERLRHTLGAILELHQEGSTPSVLTVSGRLRNAARLDLVGGHAWVDALTTHAVTAGLPDLVRDVRDLYTWRERQAASAAAVAAADQRDPAALTAAEARLAEVAIDQPGRQATDPASLAARYRADRDDEHQQRWPWPWEPLNHMTRGGMRPKQLTFLSGATRFGKSVIGDMILESAADNGANSRLYMNEMSEEERVERCVARGAAVPMDRLADNHPRDRARADAWLDKPGLAFEIEDVAGWAAQDVARDVLYRRPDVVFFDLLDELPLLPGMNRRETTEESMRIFKQLAQQARCHVIVCGHMNRNRASGRADVPIPTLGDIRESGLIAARSHNVLLLHRSQDEKTGNPLDDGLLVAAKVRGGRQGAVPLTFHGKFQRFDLDDSSPAGDPDRDALEDATGGNRHGVAPSTSWSDWKAEHAA